MIRVYTFRHNNPIASESDVLLMHAISGTPLLALHACDQQLHDDAAGVLLLGLPTGQHTTSFRAII